MEDLKEIAMNAINNPTESENTEAKSQLSADEDDTIIIGDYTPIEKKEEVKIGPVPVAPVGINLETKMPEGMELYLDKLKPEDRVKYAEYKNSLITNGMNESNANKMMNDLIKRDFNIKESSDNIDTINTEESIDESTNMDLTAADIAVIEIDKKTATKEDLALTEEEHAKLESVKAIKLIVVEDEELKSIKIDKVKTEHKADYIKSIEGSLSNYSLPLPTMGDFVSFKGAQIMQLASAVTYEDEKMHETINKKASLIYDKLFAGKVLKKYKPNGDLELTYEGFANIFPFADLDISLYGILVASSMEETDAEIPCEKCERKFNHKYNLKTILNMDEIPDHFKEKLDFILGNKGNPTALKKLSDDMAKVLRLKSPFTNNIYDISYPTVARASNIFSIINDSDSVMVYLSVLAIYLNKIYVYNKAKDSYVEITEDEIDTLMQAVSDIPDEDFKLLLNQIQDRYAYTPKFVIEPVCPHCGHKMRLDLNIDGLVFLKAQDSLKEIR